MEDLETYMESGTLRLHPPILSTGNATVEQVISAMRLDVSDFFA
jgi:hypothetical protein